MDGMTTQPDNRPWLRSLTISAFKIRLTKDQELRQSGFKPRPLYHSHKVILCLSGNNTADTQS